MDRFTDPLGLVSADSNGALIAGLCILLFCDAQAARVRTDVHEALFKALATAPDHAWSPLQARLIGLSRGSWHIDSGRDKHIGNLVGRAAFPGRLDVARDWLNTTSTGLFAAGCAIVAHEGDRDDLVRMRALSVATSDKATLDIAIARLRGRLEASGATGGALSLNEDAGGLALATPSDEAR